MFVDTKPELEKDIILERNRSGKPRRYKLIICGTGNIARDTAQRASRMSVFNGIGFEKIYFCASDDDKSKERAKELCDEQPGDIDAEAITYDELGGVKNNADIILIATDNRKANRKYFSECKKKGEHPVRLVACQNNIELVDMIAECIRDDDNPFKGMLLVASNQTDLLAYRVALKSRLNPRQIAALNHVDTFRFREELAKRVKKHEAHPTMRYRSEAVVWGSHDSKHGMAFMFSDAFVNAFNVYNIGYLDLENISDRVRNKGTAQQEKLGSSRRESADAFEEVFAALMNEIHCVGPGPFLEFNEPVFMNDPEREEYAEHIPKIGLFTGFPTYFNNLRTELIPVAYSFLSEIKAEQEYRLSALRRARIEDKLVFFKSCKHLESIVEGWLDELGVDPVKKIDDYTSASEALLSDYELGLKRLEEGDLQEARKFFTAVLLRKEGREKEANNHLKKINKMLSKSAEVIERTRGLEGLIEKADMFLDTCGYKQEKAYDIALGLVDKLNYSNKDVETLSTQLAQFNDKRKFHMLGVYLSALVNKVAKKGDKISFDFRYLEKHLDSVGMFNENAELDIFGDVGNGFGYYMKSGNLTLNGNAGDYALEGQSGGNAVINGNVRDRAGYEKTGGKLFVDNARNNLGEKAKGGLIQVRFNAEDNVALDNDGATILIDGHAKDNVCEGMKSGTVVVRGSYRNLGNILGGEFYHKEAKVFPG